MLQKAALAFGVIFMSLGLLGLMSGITTPKGTGAELLFGIFEVGLFLNLVYLSSGVLALLASVKVAWSRLYFQIAGIVYVLVVILSMMTQPRPVLGIVPVNTADTILHIVVVVSALYLGFVYKARDAVKTVH